MKNETRLVKKEELNVVRFQSNLNDLPGWNTLDTKTQGLLYEVKRNMFERQRLRALGEFGDMIDLNRVERALEGKEVKMKDFMRDIYPGVDESSITRKLAVFREIVSTVPSDMLEEVMTIDSETLSHFSRIKEARPGDVLSAARELPPFTVGQKRDPAKYLAALDEKIAELRSNISRKGKEIMDKRAAQKMLANSVIHYAHAASVRTSSQAIGFLQTPIGWAMESLGVHGVIRIKRLPIPDGVIVRRGRPRMTEEEKRKAKEARIAAGKNGKAR